MSKHTPGPSGRAFNVRCATCGGTGVQTNDDLLALLKDAQAALDYLAVQARGTGYAQSASLRAERCRAAIAKAEGAQ